MRRRPDRLHFVFVLLVVPVLLALLAQGCAASQAARTARTQRDLRRALLVLEQRTDADSLAAAGLVARLQAEPALSLSLLARATAAAPERADLRWLAIEICRQAPGCHPEPEELRVRVLDPSNGASWLYAIARASASNDQPAITAALAELAHTQRVDIYWTTLVARLTSALADAGDVPVTDAVQTVIGVLAAQAIPAYRTTLDLCLGPRLGDPERLEQCRRVAAAFEQGDTYIMAMIGARLAQRVWPSDSAPWLAAEQSRRIYEYRSGLLTHLEAGLLRDPQSIRKFLALCAQNRREQDVVRIELVDAGKNPDPPPGWTSRRP